MRGPYFFRLLMLAALVGAGGLVASAHAQEGTDSDGSADASADGAAVDTAASSGAEPADAATEAPATLPLAVGAELPDAIRFFAPDDVLSEEPGEGISLAAQVAQSDAPLVLVWWSPTCPVATRYTDQLAALPGALGDSARVVVAVPRDAVDVEEARQAIAEKLPGFSVLVDADGSAARALGVRVSPTALVFDASGALRFRGPIDDDRRARGRDATPILRPAIDALLAGKDIADPEVRPFGSSLR